LSKRKLEFKHKNQVYCYLPSSFGLSTISSSKSSLNVAKEHLCKAIIFGKDLDCEAFEIFIRDSLLESEKLLKENSLCLEFLRNIPVDIFIRLIRTTHICQNKNSEICEVDFLSFFSSFNKVTKTAGIILAMFSFYSTRTSKEKVPNLVARARDNMSLEIKKNGLMECKTSHWLKDTGFFRFSSPEDSERLDIIAAIDLEDLEIVQDKNEHI
jgi:hypothetical protein